VKSAFALVSLLLSLLPLSAAAFEQGDILYVHGNALVRLDPQTGAREVLSGCSLPDYCIGQSGGVVGSGPLWVTGTALPQPDGSVLVVGAVEDQNPGILYRVSLPGGDRVIITTSEDGGFEFIHGDVYSLVPSFAPQVAALPAWGLPLAVGLFLGLSLRRGRR
jgi:hypothetical protein